MNTSKRIEKQAAEKILAHKDSYLEQSITKADKLSVHPYHLILGGGGRRIKRLSLGS